MTDERKRKELYSNLLKDNYDLPAYDKFTSDMADENLRRELYDNLIKDNYDLPAFEQFTSDIIGDKLNTPTPQPTAKQTTATTQPKAPVKTVEQQSKERLLDLAEKKFGTRDENKLRQMAQEQFGTTDPKEIQQIAKDYVQGGGMKPVQKKTTPTTPTDPVQAAIQEAYNTAKATTSDPIKQGEELANQLRQKAVEMYGEENLPEVTKNFQQAVKEETENRNVREQIANLSQDIDRLREEEVEKATDKVIDEVAKQKQKLNDKNSSIGDKARAAFRLNTMTGSNTQGLYGPNTGTIGQELRNANVRQLDAAKLILRDAKRMIAEADHNAQEGTFGKWWESSFAGGVARGFAQRITDLSTWDFGLSDVEKGALLYDALNKADKGEQLTPSEQALLDAVTINALTEQYFANQVGRGYKAGQVSAEAIPFMLEMIINPASGIGTALSSKLTRYAIKRFGKAAAKKGVKGFLAKAGTKAVKYGTQAGGSILAGGAMATTTGAGRTTAGAFERANEALMRGEKVDWGEAWWDALKSSTISYSTEMLGELFRPIKSFIGKGAGKLASSNFGKAIRLDKVQRFIDDVSSTQLSQIVNDFEKNAKWTGTFEEYLEEVLDNTGQAAFVGDQRFRGADGRILFSNDPEAVFNLENNIDTFISVALLGGVFSGIRTVGYRTPKYKARKQMEQASDEALSAFNGNSDLWNGFRNSLSFGNVEEVKTVLRDVMTNPDYTEQQKRAVWEYAGKATAYKGILSSEQKRRASGEETQQQIDAEMSFERGYNSDEQAAHDIALEMNDEALGNRSAEERKAAWDGVQQSIEDQADLVATQLRREMAKTQHRADQMVKEVNIIDEDDPNKDKTVYLIDGNVTMLQGGKDVDTENSDQMVTIYDPNTGEKKAISSGEIRGFVSVMSADDVDAQIQNARDSFVQQAIDKAQGKITVNIGDEIPLSSGIMGKVLAISEDGEEITVGGIDENGNPQQEVMQRSDLQAVADATAIESYYQRHPDITRVEESETAEQQQPVSEEQQTPGSEETEQQTTEETPQTNEVPQGYVEGVPDDYTNGMEVTLNEDGELRHAVVLHRVRYKNGQFTPDENGNIVELITDSDDVVHKYVGELNNAIESYYVAPPEDTAAEEPQDIVEPATESETPAEQPETAISPERHMYDNLAAKHGEKAKHKIDVTFADREKAVTDAKNALDKAQKKYDDAPIGKEEKAEKDLQKAQTDYDNAVAERDFWGKVKKESDREWTIESERQWAERNAQIERAREADNQKRDRLEAEAKQRQAEWEEQRRRELEEERLKAEQREARKSDVERQIYQLEDDALAEVDNMLEQMSQERGDAMRQVGHNNKVRKAKEIYGDAIDLDPYPQNVQELVAKNLPGKIRFDSERGERSLRDEVGRNMSIEPGGDLYEMTRGTRNYIANEKDIRNGDYITFGDAVQSIYESDDNILPDGNVRYTDNEIRNAVIGMFMTAKNPSDIYDYWIGNRVKQAEAYKQAEESAYASTALDEAIMRKTGGLTLAEYEAELQNVKEKAEAVANLTEEEYNNLILGEYDRTTETDLAGAETERPAESGLARRNGATGAETLRGQESVGTETETNDAPRADEDTRGTEPAEQPRGEVADEGNKNEEIALKPENTETNGETERDNAEQRPISGGLREQPAGEAPRGSDGVDIMVLGAQLSAEQLGDYEKGSRAEQEEVGHRIIENAKRNGVFIDRSTHKDFGERVKGVSGESVVYINEANNRVIKVKDPYAKTNLKGHSASDALYEHIVHNLLFPNTQYRLIGISDDVVGDVRFVLEQDYMKDAYTPASQADIDWYLTQELGLTKVEKPYLHYENDYYSITDVDSGSDNVLINGEGAICFIDPIIKFKKPAQEVINYLTTGNAIAAAEAEVDTNPTEGQKEAGNYKKGHLKLDGYDITIEQPKGSIRRGTDDNGKQWEQEMHNTYGYIRGTEGVDGDHIDVFLSDDPTQGNVYVIDQVNPKTGEFDEHKVMYGFPDMESARKAYLSNYEEGWRGLGAITPVSKEEFKKWIESSHRKTKPFADYKSVNTEQRAVVPDNSETDQGKNEKIKVSFTFDVKSPLGKQGTPLISKWLNISINAADRKRGFTKLADRIAKLKEDNNWKNGEFDLFVVFDKNGEIVGVAGNAREAYDTALYSDNETFYVVRDTKNGNKRTFGFTRGWLFTDEIPSEEWYGADGRLREDVKTAATSQLERDLDHAPTLPTAQTEGGESTAKSKPSLTDVIKTLAEKGKTFASRIYQRSFFDVAQTPEFMKELGVSGEKFTVSYGTISRHFGKDAEHELSESEWEQLQDAITKPFAITKYFDDKNHQNLKGYRLYTIIPKGKGFVVVGVDVKKVNQGKNKPVLEINSISTVFGKDGGITGFEEEIYRSENINPQQAALLERPNSSQYPSVGDFSGKDTKNSETDQKNIANNTESEQKNYTITPAQYTTKRNKVLDMHLVTFDRELTKDELAAGKEIAKQNRGWYDRDRGGFMMRNEESARQLAETLSKGDEQAIADAQPLSVADIVEANNNALTEENATKEQTQAEQKNTTNLFNNVEKGDVLSNGLGLTATILKKIDDGKSRAVQLKWEREVENGQNGKGVEIFNATNFNKWCEENGIQKPTATATEQPQSQAEKEQPEQEEPKGSNWVDDEDKARFDELKEMLRKKLRGQLNMGFDSEAFSIGVEMSYLMLKHGARKFKDFAKNMIEALGESIRPYLKSLYNGARDLPEMAEYKKEMTPYDEVRTFDVENFDKEGAKDLVKTAATVVREQEVEQEAEQATEKIKKKRNENRKENEKNPVSLQNENQLDLFGGSQIKTENNENTNVQTGTSETGRGGYQPQQNEPMGGSAGNETERPDGRGVGGRDKYDSGNDGVGGVGVSKLPAGEQRIESEQSKRNLNNNHAERGTDYAPKGVDARIEANIKAIELMQQLVESGQKATPEQMSVLRKYSGWGGLGKAFSNLTEIDGVKTTAGRLRDLLGDEGYEQANMSRNSAYFTPAHIIDTLWDIARALGFKGGNVLEGSAGIGNIIGLMPQDMSERSNIHAVEIDQTTGNILSLLYPDAKVDVQGFEATQVKNGSVDLCITNVPFVTGLRVNDTTGDKDLSKKFHDIHDFCIAKNVRKLRDGGIGIFITSSGTLDNSQKLRDWLVSEGNADVVGAFRLNNETFGGTAATSDIIVIRKRVNGKKSAHAIDVLPITGERVAEYDTGETKKVKGQEIRVVKNLSMDYNKYFVQHPEMMGGEMAFGFERGDNYRPTSKGLYPKRGVNQNERLQSFVQSLQGFDDEAAAPVSIEANNNKVYESLGDDVKEGSMVVSNGQLCVARYGQAVPLNLNKNKVKGHTKEECFNSYKKIKDALSAVLEYQTTHEENDGLKPLLDELNNAYDNFVNVYGRLHKNMAIPFLKNDVDFANILALEKYNERIDVKTGERIAEYGKTDIFSKRVVEKEKTPSPTNVKDGITASIYMHGRIDLPWIAEKITQSTGKPISEKEVQEEIINSGLGFENPATTQMEVSYEYLSGNVREKLQQANEANGVEGQEGKYSANIKALENVIPMNIPAHLIDFSIGSSWITPELYEEYIKERTDIDVKCVNVDGTWFMRKPHWRNEEKNRAMGVVSEKLNKTILGTELIEAAMTNRAITVSETRKTWDGKRETITDSDATSACANKVDEIRQDFKDWAKAKMLSEPAFSEQIEQIYNEKFNNFVPKSIPEEYVPKHFGGAATIVDNKPFSLRPHQGKAAVRATTQPLLLAHEVGTGKTYTLITAAMEMRRLGTARKPMIVVQNSTVGQFVESAKKLYPNAKVLTIDDKEHDEEGRKNFYAKIKYNDWDMIVVPQSVFERIPDSEERQMAFVADKIEEKEKALELLQDEDIDGSSWIVKQAEREINDLQAELTELTAATSKKKKERDEKKDAIVRQNAEVKAFEMLDRMTDNVENFDDMGIDALLVDEAHEYKHLGFATAMQRGVKGIDPSYSKKAQGVYLKTQAVLEKNNGRNVVFATGTPISNTAAEIWTFMRYLMPADTMKDYGIYYFDDFVRNFGNLTQMLEFTTSGKFKENNRFAGYVNLPELVRIWSGVADTVLTKEAGGVNDKIPEMEGGKAKDIYLPQTKSLRAVMKYVKAELDRFDNMTSKEKKKNRHIPLKMYGIAKAAAVDARLVVSDAIDEPQSKTNEAVRQTLKSLEQTKSYNGTVAIFADNYQNKRSGFNLYEDIRQKLIEAGIPAEQIVVMKSGMSVNKKLDIFDRVNRGEVRVIMGSTFTLGTGVNIQERLHTLIHLDAPNRPMDYTQRNGRILRQGNLHKEMGIPVRVLRFGVEDSLDVTAYQRLKTKGAIADSIMNGKQMLENSMENRAIEEEEDVFGDTVAQLSGSEYAMLKNQAEKDVRKYENKKKQWEADQTYCHNEIPRLESTLRNYDRRLKQAEEASQKVEQSKKQHKGQSPAIVIDGKTYPNIEALADFIKEFNKKVKEAENSIRENPYGTSEKKLTIKINVGGFNFTFNTKLSYETSSEQGNLFNAIRRKMTYDCEELGMEDTPVKQSLLRVGLEDIIENIVSGKEFAERVEKLKQSIAKTQESLKQVKAREGKPFEFTKELETAHRRFDEYSELMKKEMAEKEQKYAEVDAEVDAATEVTEAEEASEEETDSPAYRDEDTTPPDPWLSTYEESLASARRFGYTKKQHDAFIERSRRYTRKFIADAVAKLNLTDDVQVVETIDEVQGLTEQEREKRRKKRGWYDPKTNRIVIILENHHSRDDVLKTILHEGAGHYGLRKMFGKHFDDFLDNVYEHSEPEIRRAITKLARDKYNYDFRRATEEYLATMAEGMESDLRYDTLGGNSDELPEQFWSWQKIKDLFWEMMSKIGLKIKSWFYGSIGENELRYVLWSSYQRLKYPGRYRDFVRTAEDVVMQEELKVGDFEQPAEERRGWWEKSEAEEKEEIIEDMGLNNEEAARLRKEMEKEETRKRTRENQTWRKLKERHPNDLVMLSDGKGFYSMYGEDAERVANLLGIVLRKTKEKGGVYVISFPERDLDGYLHKLINAGHRVAVGETLDADKVSEDVAEYERRAPIKPYPVQKNTEQGDDVYFRDEDDDGDNFTDRDRAIARDEYERIVATGGYQFQEAMQDSMLGLRKAMQAILGAGKDFRIEEVPGNENAYLAENRMSSTNKAEQHYYYVLYMKPLLKAIHLIAGNSEAKRQELADYMMAKHGLERNLKFAERDFAEYQKEYPATNKTIDDYRDRDYAGLTALTGETNVAAAEAKAQMMVDEYEANHDVTLLWEATKRATGVTLAKIYRSGLLSKESYEQIRDQFDYYIPLQGFDETTSDEVYGYLTSRKGPFGSPIKHAEGRTSKADDPIATIALMADKAIQQANRNEMKKLFLNFVENHPSDLVSVSKLWLHKDAATGDWVPVFPDIEADDTPAEVERKVEEFETKMQQLAEQHPKEYKSGMDAKNFPYRVLPENRNEHQVLVKRNGETFVLTINGNPRAAQALNGLTNPDVKTGGFIGGAMKTAQFVNHQLSAFYTTRDPNFVVSNFFRDMLYSNCMTWVKEGGNYALNFHKNFGKFNPATMRWLFGKWDKGTLDDSKPIEYMFKQFMLNGGETGYTDIRDIEAHKREIARELKRQSSTTRQVWSALGKQLDLLNESVENCARFAAFITSMEMGRSLERSIYDAKEVSVNFNKKGSGDKMVGATGQTKAGKLGSYLSGAGRLLYVFWNAGLQGMTNFGRAAKRHPAKFTAGAAAMFTLGAVIPLIAKALWGGDDDDENAYYNLPEYVRRSNICIGAGDQWITIPLPIEFRAIYGMGELATGVITGEEHYSKGETARQIISQGSQILPLDFMEGGGGWHAFIPTAVKPIVEASSNKSWVGLPIYKDTPYNQNDPEFTKAYKSADKNIVGASRWLNELTGGDDFKKGAIDINPSKVEYVLNGYLGGYFKVPNQLVKMAETAFGDREFEWKNMIMANRLVKSGDERTANRKLQNEFFNLKAEYEETKRLLKKYENAANEGVLKYAEKLDYLENSKEYGRYLIFDEYKKDIDGAYKAMKEAEDAEIYKASENEYYEYLRELVDAIHRYEKGEDVNSILNYQSN